MDDGRWKMEEGGQGMKVIEKTRWEGGKTVGVKRARRRMKRGMEGNEECVKRKKIGKTRKHTR